VPKLSAGVDVVVVAGAVVPKDSELDDVKLDAAPNRPPPVLPVLPNVVEPKLRAGAAAVPVAVVVAGAFVAGLLNPKLNGDDPPKLRDIF
jgi:hypothetical protein